MVGLSVGGGVYDHCSGFGLQMLGGICKKDCKTLCPKEAWSKGSKFQEITVTLGTGLASPLFEFAVGAIFDF